VHYLLPFDQKPNQPESHSIGKVMSLYTLTFLILGLHYLHPSVLLRMHSRKTSVDDRESDKLQSWSNRAPWGGAVQLGGRREGLLPRPAAQLPCQCRPTSEGFSPKFCPSRSGQRRWSNIIPPYGMVASLFYFYPVKLNYRVK
jgi:hypothetical protein